MRQKVRSWGKSCRIGGRRRRRTLNVRAGRSVDYDSSPRVSYGSGIEGKWRGFGPMLRGRGMRAAHHYRRTRGSQLRQMSRPLPRGRRVQLFNLLRAGSRHRRLSAVGRLRQHFERPLRNSVLHKPKIVLFNMQRTGILHRAHTHPYQRGQRRRLRPGVQGQLARL